MLEPENVQKAQDSIDSHKDEFVKWAKDDIATLKTNLQAANNGSLTPEHLEAIINSAENLRDRGGTFGYPLLSQIAKSLVNYCTEITDPSSNHAVVIAKHIEGLQIIHGNKIEGEGGSIGKELMGSLTELTDKYKAS